MKKYLLRIIAIVIALISNLSIGQSGIFESYIIIDDGSPAGKYYDLQATTGNDDFNNFNLGTYNLGNDLIIKGFQNKTDKCNTDDILNAELYYRIYPQSATPTGFSSISTTNVINQEDNPNCNPTMPPNADSRQTWEDNTQNINITNGLAPGDYYFEVYSTSNYTWTASGGGSGIHTADNTGAFYRATFRADNPPTANCITTLTVYLDATGNASINTTDINNGSTDDFDTPILSIDVNSFDCSNIGSPVIVTLTAEDSLGQTDTCTTTVTVVDTINPDTPALTDITAECNATVTAPTTTDNCGTIITGTTSDATTFNTQGTYTITWNFDDGNGNDIDVIQNIEIDDVTAPVPDVATLADMTDECEVTALTPPSATDNCGGSVTVTHNATLPITTQGTTVVTWTYDDGNGNTSTQTQDVVINDVTAPVPDVATLANVTAECEVTALTPPSATDNCGGTVTVTHDASLPITTQGTTVVTWTYDDGNGNTSTQTQNVIIYDVTAPIPDVATLADVTDQCEVTALTPPSATDNCGGSVTVTHDASLPIATQGTTVVTWTYDDGNGNTSTQTQDVVINDVTAPVPDVATLANVTAECEVTALTPPSATDNCGGTVTVTHDASLPITTQGTTVVTWTYDDGNGNTSTQTQNVIIYDVTAPIPDVATLADVTDQCEVTALTPPSATDNCGGSVTVTHDASLPIATQGTTVVTWTYDDGNGNTSTQTQDVVINDVTAPVPDVATLANVTAECEVTALTPPSATDNCGGTITVTHDATLPITTQGTTVVTWTYDDGNGNTSTQTQDVVINDITAPVPDVATLADVTDQCEVTALTPPSATDNCGGTITVTHDASLPISTQGTTVVTWTYDDGNGNTSTQTQDVVINDITAPVPDVATLADVTDECEVTALTPPSATDNCGGSVTVTHNATLPITTQGTTVVTWTYDDGNGNTSTQTQDVVINDITAPVPDVATLADVTAECEVTALTPPSATDNCGGTVTVTHNATLPITVQGTTVVTWTYDDGNGNTSTQTQDVVINDITAPVPDVATLADVTDECEVTALTPPSATDNCGGTVTVTHDASLPITTQGTTVVTWTYDDGNGNTSTQTQNVVIDDVTAPVPDVATLANVTSECEVTALTPPSATDNCGGSVTVTHDATLPITTQGTTVVTWTYDDGNGNTSTQTQNVVIDDITNPTINCPSNITTTNDAGLCSAIITYSAPTGSDNCGSVTITQTAGLPSGSAFPVGTTTNTFEIEDTAGNTTSCSFTVTVNDNENPTIACPSDITVDADSNCEATSVTLINPTVNDNCNVDTITNNAPATFPLGNTTVTWTVTDLAGNSSQCTQIVTVNDVTPPTITCPGDITVNADTGLCTASGVNLGTPTVDDNCGVGYSNDAPTIFPLGQTIVTWTATDGYSNSTTCTQIVTVVDNEAPNVICQSLSLQLNPTTGLATITANDIDNGSTDNCSIANMILSQTTFDCNDIGTNTVTLTVTDGSGNSDSCTATVTITDAAQGASVSISASNNPICAGEAVTFTATPVNGGATPSYEWFVNGGSVGNNSNTFTTSTLTNNDQVSVEMTSSLSVCATAVSSNTITMTVNPPLPVTFNLNASANPACNGDNLTFFVTGLTNGGSNPSYQWYVNSNPVGANTNSYSSSAINNGDIVSVSVTSNATCATPIPATESLTMTVTPDATISLTSANNNQTICNGDSLVNITYNIANATGATITGIPTGISGSYNSGVFTISGTPSQIGTFNYTVTPIGCGGNTATGTITVGPDATITLLSGSENQGICNDNSDSVNLQFQLNSGATGATLTSTPALPAGITGSYNGATGIYTISGTTTQAGVYNYTVSTIGCGSGDSISGIITVYNGVPSTPNNINGPFSLFCPVAELVYSVPYDPNVETYNWTVSGGLTIESGQGSNQVTITVNGTFAFFETVSVSTTNACGTSSTASELIFLNFSGTDIDAGPDIYVCEGTTQVTMNGNAGGLNYDEWTWDDNGAGGSFSTELVGNDCVWVCTDYFLWWCVNGYYDCSDIYDYTETSTYTIPSSAQPGDIITISLLAESTFWCDPLESTMQIHIIENPDATISSSDVTLCQGDSTTITFTGTPNSEIRYNDGSGNTWLPLGPSGSTTITVSPTTTTTYSLNRVRYNPATYPGGGNNCALALNETVTVNINEPATITAPNDITICEGETVNLSSTTYSGTNPVVTWTTSGSGNFSGNTYTPSAGDIFNGSVTLTAINTPSDGICPSDSDTMVVTINPLATVYAGVDQTICEGDSVTLSSASYGGSATSASWSTAGDGGFVGNIYTPGASDITNGSVVLTYTTNNPSGPCGSASDTVTITINQAATVNAGNDVTICEGDVVNLSSANYSGSATSATWSTSGTGNFSGSIYTPSAADITNGSVTLTYTTNNPAGPCGVAVDSKVVTINPLPVVDAGTNQAICETSGSINLNATLGGSTTATWSSSGDGTFNNNNPNAIYTLGANDITNGSVTLTYTTNSAIAPCSNTSDSVTYTIVPFTTASASIAVPATGCTAQITLSGNGSGQWSATSSTGHSFSFSNVNDPNATFIGESGGTYSIIWTITNPSPCGNSQATLANISFPNCGNNIDFDGIDDTVSFNDNFDLNGPFSIEIWVKPNALGTIKTIYSKRNALNLSTGFDLRLVNNTLSFRWNGGGQVSATGLTTNRWYHTAVTFDGSTYRLYVDGVEINSNTGGAPNANNRRFLLGAMDRNTNIPTNHFNGWLDELRIWNTALTATQIREMMNQEIEQNGANVRGSVLGLDIAGLNWANLDAYYQMNQAFDVTGGLLNANFGGINGNLLNINSTQQETSPLPYVSNQNGTWNNQNTWLNGTVQQVPNTNGINGTSVNWNIVRTQHDVTSGNRATTVLGLLVDANRYSITNDQQLNVSKYLKIDGVLDLVGESQLLQPNNSIVDYTGSGRLERDQEGTSNLYNYNYWGSPVSTLGASNSRTYAIGSILYDGNNPVSWTTGYDANGATNPVTLSSNWLYNFLNGAINDYSSWISINSTSNVNVGLGFTMKGSGAATPNQTYTFRGQPNNGTITHSISGSNLALVGNPYPSAIDANTFIDDNGPMGSGTLPVGTGALIFWEQAPSNNSHYLSEYEGVYAYYTKLGGVPSVTPPEINGSGNTGKIPQRYVPVGQGFFVLADADGGTITFNNSQRTFVKETSGASVFMRSNGLNLNSENSESEAYNDGIKRLRLKVTTSENAGRHLLLGFTPNNEATDGVDYGYDAQNRDQLTNDASWSIEDNNYIIQGVGEFDELNTYPLNIHLSNQGNVSISLTDLENFDEDIDVFVYDSTEDSYTQINYSNFNINLEAGDYNGRFNIVFVEDNSLSVIDTQLKDITVKYLHNSNELYIKTPSSINAKQIYMINIAGQVVKSWNMTNLPLSDELRIPVKNISEGNYVVKIETNTSSYSKKVIVKY
ncbi:HYR domain-containing protein [Flavobacteriaceae bacterium 144Ye]|nr:HYR domain-containing protein [Flavobacteriaceae bacterium 144Ye]